MIITRKIELWVAAEDKTIKNEQWARLRELNEAVYQAANRVVSEQYINEVLENRFVMQDGRVLHIDEEIRKQYRKKSSKDEEERRLAEDSIASLKEHKRHIREEVKPHFALGKGGASKLNSTLQILSRSFSNIPTDILNALNATVVKTLNQELKEIRKGTQSLRTYRKGMPIPFTKKALRFEGTESGEVSIKWLSDIVFKVHFGRDRSNNRTIIEKAMSGEYKISDSSLQLKDKKIFLLLCVNIPEKENLTPIPNLYVGVDLGINTPVYCALSEGYERLAVGNRKDLFDWRTRLRVRRRQLQGAIRETTGGKGRKKRLKALDRFENAERNYVHTYNHLLSKRIIEFAQKHHVSVVKMELLEGYGKDDDGKLLKGDYILSRWSYFELQTMIAYKAKMAGVEIQFIDPYHTSQTCAKCGHYEQGQRETQSEFICKNLTCNPEGESVNADYNAALNIARSQKVVTKKEDCTFYKLKNQQET